MFKSQSPNIFRIITVILLYFDTLLFEDCVRMKKNTNMKSVADISVGINTCFYVVDKSPFYFKIEVGSPKVSMGVALPYNCLKL